LGRSEAKPIEMDSKRAASKAETYSKRFIGKIKKLNQFRWIQGEQRLKQKPIQMYSFVRAAEAET
jgi:hypothetical protein